MHYQFIECPLQDDLKKKESQLADLQENIKSQQAEASKAKDELTSTLSSMEKLKEDFKNERAKRDADKAILVKWAEDAETALKPMTEELTGLKRQINAMTSAVFGKYLLHELFLNILGTAGLTTILKSLQLVALLILAQICARN